MKTIIFLLFPVFLFSQNNVDTLYSAKKEIEYKRFTNLNKVESYLVCELVLDSYFSVRKKELSSELLLQILTTKDFVLMWLGDYENVEGVTVKCFKFKKDDFFELLSL